jgi:preprotein translocase subunit SecY
MQSSFLTAFSDYTSLTYNLTFAFMIIAFTFFYTAITVNPVQMSDDMKKNDQTISNLVSQHDEQRCYFERNSLAIPLIITIM